MTIGVYLRKAVFQIHDSMSATYCSTAPRTADSRILTAANFAANTSIRCIAEQAGVTRLTGQPRVALLKMVPCH